MLRTITQRAKLSAGCHRNLDSSFGRLRRLYNAALQADKAAYEATGKGLTYYDLCRLLTEMRRDDPGLAMLSVDVLRSMLRREARAKQGFFRRHKAGKKPGYPRFKGKRRGIRSFEIQRPNLKPRSQGYALFVQGAGYLQFKTLPEGKIKLARVIRSLGSSASRWASISVSSKEPC